MKPKQMVEQHISEVKLEKQRQKVIKKSKFIFKLPFIVFAIYIALPLVIFITIFTKVENVGNLIIYFVCKYILVGMIISAVSFSLYYMLSYKKAYDLFNFNYKTKYVTDVISQIDGFSNLNYYYNDSFSYEELDSYKIIPMGLKVSFVSKDNLTGTFKDVNFRSGSIETATAEGKHRKVLFSGQVIDFELFDSKKISNGRVQIFSNKKNIFTDMLAVENNEYKMKYDTLSHKIETEDAKFNEHFCVYADDEHNAFYILNPVVIESITKLFETAEDELYIVFDNEHLFIAANQNRNPFDAYIDIPIEEQKGNIIKDTALIQNVRNILINIK